MECRTGDDISSRLWEVLWESFSQAHLHAVYNLATGVLGNTYTITKVQSLYTLILLPFR